MLQCWRWIELCILKTRAICRAEFAWLFLPFFAPLVPNFDISFARHFIRFAKAIGRREWQIVGPFTSKSKFNRSYSEYRTNICKEKNKTYVKDEIKSHEFVTKQRGKRTIIRTNLQTLWLWVQSQVLLYIWFLGYIHSNSNTYTRAWSSLKMNKNGIGKQANFWIRN